MKKLRQVDSKERKYSCKDKGVKKTSEELENDVQEWLVANPENNIKEVP